MGYLNVDLRNCDADSVRPNALKSYTDASANRDGASLKRSLRMRTGTRDVFIFSFVMIADLSTTMKLSGNSKWETSTIGVVGNGGGRLFIKALKASGKCLKFSLLLFLVIRKLLW